MLKFSQKRIWGEFHAYTGIFYAFLFIIYLFFFNKNQALHMAKLRTLNRLMPPLNEIVSASQINKPLDDALLNMYLLYYSKVSDYLPENADGYYMKGYCLFHKGYLYQAVKSYQQSIDLNPHFFWSYYNLGLLYLKLNQRDAAINSFRMALNTKPENALKIMLTSKVFQQLMVQLKEPQKNLPINLKSAYQDCYQFMILSEYLKTADKHEIPEQIYNRLEAKIF